MSQKVHRVGRRCDACNLLRSHKTNFQSTKEIFTRSVTSILFYSVYVRMTMVMMTGLIEVFGYVGTKKQRASFFNFGYQPRLLLGKVRYKNFHPGMTGRDFCCRRIRRRPPPGVENGPRSWTCWSWRWWCRRRSEPSGDFAGKRQFVINVFGRLVIYLKSLCAFTYFIMKRDEIFLCRCVSFSCRETINNHQRTTREKEKNWTGKRKVSFILT